MACLHACRQALHTCRRWQACPQQQAVLRRRCAACQPVALCHEGTMCLKHACIYTPSNASTVAWMCTCTFTKTCMYATKPLRRGGTYGHKGGRSSGPTSVASSCRDTSGCDTPLVQQSPMRSMCHATHYCQDSAPHLPAGLGSTSACRTWLHICLQDLAPHLPAGLGPRTGLNDTLGDVDRKIRRCHPGGIDQSPLGTGGFFLTAFDFGSVLQ